MSEGANARGIWVAGSHGYIAHNKIEGKGYFAIDVSATDTPFLSASYNFLQGNNFNLFDATLSDLHFAYGADNNIFVGYSGNVSDQGADNRITNFNFRGKASNLKPKSSYDLTGNRGK